MAATTTGRSGDSLAPDNNPVNPVDPDGTEQERAKQRPRRSLAYLTLAGVYAAATATGALAVRARDRRRGLAAAVSGRQRVPDRLSADDLMLMGVATFKLSRLLTRAKVTMPIREPFATYERPGAAAEVMMTPRGSGLQRATGELLTCPFCVAQWIGTAFVFRACWRRAQPA